MTIENLTDTWKREATTAFPQFNFPGGPELSLFKTVLQKDVSKISLFCNMSVPLFCCHTRQYTMSQLVTTCLHISRCTVS